MRLKMQERPQHRHPVMVQKWRDLLFLHWEYDPQAIQDTLPDGLSVDTFDGKAYLGVIPFFARNTRSRFLPPIPGFSNYHELNVRTYVYDRNGIPGIWFYSLDANHFLAVIGARLVFHLPYFYASMPAESHPDEITYTSHRSSIDSRLKSHFQYHPTSDLFIAKPGTLEFFLIERYVLFASSKKNKLYSGRVWHKPYPLAEVEVSQSNENILRLDGFSNLSSTPAHQIMSPGVDAEIFNLEEANLFYDKDRR